MTRIRLKINVAGTGGTEAWEKLQHFPEVAAGRFGPDEGSGGPCLHRPSEPHAPGEWMGAVVLFEKHLLAEYAVAHYLEQPSVIDAFLDGTE